MYKVTAYFRDHRITKSFYDMYDAIEFKDNVDAHYPIKTNFEKVTNMKEFIYDSWNGVMNSQVNPLKHIPDLNTRHMVLQVLAWMWCIVFAIIVSSMWAGVISMMLHALLLAAVAITVATFETAKRKPNVFGAYNGRANGGEHE